MSDLRTYLTANRYVLLFLLAITAGYCAVMTPYYLNIPRDDDFPSLYVFARNYANGGGLGALIELYSDHRIGLIRFVALLSIWLVGSLDLQWMGYVGIWTLIPATGWLFVRFFQRANLPAIYLVPIFLWLLQPQYHRAIVWVEILYQQLPSAMFAGWAIYAAFFAATNTRRLLGSAFWSVLATFSFGSGLFAWPVVGVIWLVQRRWAQAAGWFALTGLIFWLYTYGHQRAGYLHEITVPFLLKNYPYIIQGWLAFLGAMLSADVQVTVGSVLLGVSIVGVGGLAAVRLFRLPAPTTAVDRAHWGLLAWLAYILLVGAVTALGRVYGPDGVWAVMLSRYKIYTVLALALAYSVLLIWPRYRRLTLGAGSLWGVLFCGWSYVHYLPEMNTDYNSFVASIVNWRQTGTGLFYWNQAEGDSILREAMQHHEYAYPTELPLGRLANSAAVRSAGDSALRIQQQTIVRGFGTYTFPEDVFTFRNDTDPTRSSFGNGVYVLLRSPEFTYLLATAPQPYTGRNPLGLGIGYEATMRSTLCRPGTYAVFELHVDGSSADLRPAGKTVLVRAIPKTAAQLPPVRPFPLR